MTIIISYSSKHLASMFAIGTIWLRENVVLLLMGLNLIFFGKSVVNHVLVSLRAFTTEDFKVPDKMVGFSK